MSRQATKNIKVQTTMKRRTVYKIAAPIILAPLLPFFFLREGCVEAIKLLDWMIEGRAVPRWLVRQADRLELWSLQGKR